MVKRGIFQNLKGCAERNSATSGAEEVTCGPLGHDFRSENSGCLSLFVFHFLVLIFLIFKWVNTHVASYIHILFSYFRICAHNFAPQQTRNPGAKLTAEVGEKKTRMIERNLIWCFIFFTFVAQVTNYLSVLFSEKYTDRSEARRKKRSLVLKLWIFQFYVELRFAELTSLIQSCRILLI